MMLMNKTLQEHFEKSPAHKAQKLRHHHFTSLTAARILASLLGILGVLCILFTEHIHSVFPYILGTIMAVIGLFDLYRGIMTAEFRNSETKLTSNGIVMLLLGIVILFHRRETDIIVGSVWGAIGLFKGSEELNMAIYHRFSKEPFIGEAIHSIGELLLAIMLLLDPLTGVKHHLFILGFELIWHSLKLFRECKKPG